MLRSISSRDYAEWMAFFKRRNKPRGKSPEEMLGMVEHLNQIFGGKDLRERTG
jgi:hypothetical protein